MKTKKIISLILLNLLSFFGAIILIFGGYEIYLRMHITKDDVKTVIDKPIYIPDPDLSWYHKSDISFDYNGGKAYLNQFGHRSTFDPKSEKRILMLGDSFTFGMNVGQNQTMSAVLQSKLPSLKWNVMNAGVIGYSIIQEFSYLHRELEKLKPEIVVLNVFLGNDITELRRGIAVRDQDGFPIKCIDKEVFVNEKGILSSKNPPPFGSLALKDLLDRWKEIKIQKNAYPGYIWAVFLNEKSPYYPSDINTLWNNYEKDLVKMHDYLSQKNITLLVNIIPMDVQVDKSYWSKYPNKVFGEIEFEEKIPQKRFAEICSRHNLNCIDLLPFFKENRDKQIYFKETDPHFDVDGNRLAAEAIATKLQSLNLL